MKRLLMAIVLLLSLFAVSAAAAGSDPFTFGVKYNDHKIGTDEVVEVVAGESVSFDVYVNGQAHADDVKIRAEVKGYEYGNVEDDVDAFDVNANVVYVKSLTLDIPNDMEAGEYNVEVEVYNEEFSAEKTFSLSVINLKHEVEIQDVIYDENVDAGEELDVYVRLENTGDNKEDDIKVTVSIPELGVSEQGYVDELTNEEVANEDEESSGSIVLRLTLPEGTPSGEYEMEVEVTYNNGYTSTANVYIVTVNGVEEAVEAEEDATTVVVVINEPEEAEDVVSPAEPEDSITISTSALKIGFGVLAALLVVLAIVFILRRE